MKSWNTATSMAAPKGQHVRSRLATLALVIGATALGTSLSARADNYQGAADVVLTPQPEYGGYQRPIAGELGLNIPNSELNDYIFVTQFNNRQNSIITLTGGQLIFNFSAPNLPLTATGATSIIFTDGYSRTTRYDEYDSAPAVYAAVTLDVFGPNNSLVPDTTVTGSAPYLGESQTVSEFYTPNPLNNTNYNGIDIGDRFPPDLNILYTHTTEYGNSFSVVSPLSEATIYNMNRYGLGLSFSLSTNSYPNCYGSVICDTQLSLDSVQENVNYTRNDLTAWNKYLADQAILVQGGTPPGSGGGAVPEPTTWALMIGGFGLAGVALRRRRAAAA